MMLLVVLKVDSEEMVDTCTVKISFARIEKHRISKLVLMPPLHEVKIII